MDFRWKRSSHRAFCHCWDNPTHCRCLGAQPLLAAESEHTPSILQVLQEWQNSGSFTTEKTKPPPFLRLQSKMPTEDLWQPVYVLAFQLCITCRELAQDRLLPFIGQGWDTCTKEGRCYLGGLWLDLHVNHSLPFWPHPANSSPTERPTEQLLHNFFHGSKN